MENQSAIVAFSNGINRIRIYNDRIEIGAIFTEKYSISEISGCRLGWAMPGDKAVHINKWDGEEVLGPILRRGDAEACKAQLDTLISEYANRHGIGNGIAIGCTVLGGSGTKLIPEEACIAVFSAKDVSFVQGEEASSVELTRISRIDFSGPGEVTSGGGFIGGGAGLEGAAQGIAIAAILNALTSTSEINTVIHVSWNEAEVFLHTTIDEPKALRVKLSPSFVGLTTNRQQKPQSDLVSHLERLRDLRRTGDLSDEEFEVAKKKLLS